MLFICQSKFLKDWLEDIIEHLSNKKKMTQVETILV